MAETLIPDAFTKLAYQTLQQGKAAFGLAHKNLSTRALKAVSVTGLVTAPPESYGSGISVEAIQKVKGRYEALIQQDWADAETGVYPKALLFDDAWDDFAKYYPALCLDIPQIWNRAHQKVSRDFAPDIETAGLPNYYTQNFHHQTDGYLSDRSAQIYDLQVEILFNGAADAMRRRILAPLKAGLTAFDSEIPQNLRVLDIASGTGRTLRMIRGMLPKVKLHGIDLSEAYLRKANQLLSQLPGELPQLTQGAGEALPYLDNHFHALTCVFLFHELPAPIRQQVMNEAFRVVKPGGTFVICDSVQLSDSPDLGDIMDGFSETFHEPFYRNYTQDNLVDRLETAGFTDITESVHFMSKYLVAKKPVV
jgi:ubiquinone/menaquinone biosynthesis C-methylase UbiE